MTRVWEPATTWAFIVGLLEWQRDDIYDPFPKEERRDAQLVQLLIARSVPKGQVRYLSVLDERAGVHQIAYEGYGPEFNEWVRSKRIRPLL